MERLLDRQRLLGVPCRPLVERAQDTRADPGERVELLDRRVRAVGDQRARVPERPKRIGVLRVVRPEPVGEVAVRGRVRELHRGRDPELSKPRDVLWREELGVLHPLAQAERLPVASCLLEGIEGVAIRLIADCVNGDREACP